MQFTALGLKPTELNLHFTLPTGQTFRWKRTGEDEYTGLIDQRVVCVCSGLGHFHEFHLTVSTELLELGTHSVSLAATTPTFTARLKGPFIGPRSE
jgi:hypothetical protein